MYAVAEGVVVASGWYSSTWGNIIVLEHIMPDGSKVWSVYGHLEDRWVSNGNSVSRRQQIGRVGKGDYAVAPNGGAARSAAFTVAGRTFSVSQAGAISTCSTTALTAGQAANGSLSISDCRSQWRGASYYADRYSFSGVAGQQVAISLTSPFFDTYAYLATANGSLLAQNDDGGGGTNSRIPPTSGYYLLPAAGTYVIEVTSYSANATGAYTLTLNVNGSSGGSAGCGSATIARGQTLSGSLSTSDCRSQWRGGSYYADRYTFSGTVGQQIVIWVGSAQFDTYVYLAGPSGSFLAQNDDGGGGTNSRIPATSGYFVIPSSGVYTIEVTTYTANATGAYSIQLQ